jgi:uncharacterized protein YndB with AHSA1/START domain
MTTTTRASRRLRAPRARVYRALIDAEAIARWKVPAGMACHVHEFDGREGGTFRISLTYEAPDRAGKTTAHTDTYRGRFVRLVPDELVVEADEFETDDPLLSGEMTITIRLSDVDEEAGGGTDLVAVHEGLPSGVPPADNDLGWRESLARLALLVETGE